MSAYGYLFLTAAALAFLVVFTTTYVWFVKKLMSDQDKENRISSAGLFLNILFMGLILVVTIYTYLSFTPSDYIDALLTASPLLVGAIFLSITLYVARRVSHHTSK